MTNEVLELLNSRHDDGLSRLTRDRFGKMRRENSTKALYIANAKMLLPACVNDGVLCCSFGKPCVRREIIVDVVVRSIVVGQKMMSSGQ